MDFKILLSIFVVGIILFLYFRRNTFGGVIETRYLNCDLQNNVLTPRGKLPAGNYLGLTQSERNGLLKKFINDHEN